MMLVGAEKLSPSTVFLEKEKYFIKTLLAIVYVMLGDHIVRVIDHRMHYLKKILSTFLRVNPDRKERSKRFDF